MLAPDASCAVGLGRWFRLLQDSQLTAEETEVAELLASDIETAPSSTQREALAAYLLERTRTHHCQMTASAIALTSCAEHVSFFRKG